MGKDADYKCTLIGSIGVMNFTDILCMVNINIRIVSVETIIDLKLCKTNKVLSM